MSGPLPDMTAIRIFLSPVPPASTSRVSGVFGCAALNGATKSFCMIRCWSGFPPRWYHKVIGPSAEAKDRKAKFTTETQRARRRESRGLGIFNRNAQRSGRQTRFLNVLPDSLFAPLRRCVRIFVFLRVLCVSVVNFGDALGFIGGSSGWGLGEKRVQADWRLITSNGISRWRPAVSGGN